MIKVAFQIKRVCTSMFAKITIKGKYFESFQLLITNLFYILNLGY